MTEIEKNGCDCEDDCTEHENGCDCGEDDCNGNTITLDMEDGTTKDFVVIDVIEHEGKQYIALAEVDSMEYDILSMTTVGENVELGVIEDDAEFEAVAAKFDEILSQTDEDEEADEEEEE